MYTEDYENRGFPFRDFLLKLILIIIFVFLLVWLLPKFIKPTTVENKETMKEISAISSQIFSDNLEKMKDAAISYYTDEKLPKEQGEYHQMTLAEMIGMKIITPLIDKNNKAVDVNKSYVKITKATDEYILKVNIKDSEKEDYILVHLGCYTYCDSYVCEKKETDVGVKGGKPSTTSKPSTPSTPSDDDKDDDKEEPKDDEPKDEDPKDDEPTPSKTYIYEYTKKTGIELSAWTLWSNWEKTACSTKEVNCSDSDTSCKFKLQLYKQKQAIGTYSKTQSEYKQITSYSQTTCSNYNYIIVNNKTYTTTTTYNNVNSIKGTTASSTGDWKYVGRETYANPPKSSSTVHYEFVGADFSYCNETCESLPNFFYDKYVYTGTMSQVSNTTSVPSGSSSSVTASCGSYVTKTVPVYGYVNVKNTDTLYGTVCYKSTKTRSVTNPGTPQYKWSSYNDTSLLNDGWTYTGNKKLAN